MFGVAEADSRVRIYASRDCSDRRLAVGSAAAFNGVAGITVENPIPDDELTNLRATATNEAGKVSACSDPFPYVEDSSTPTPTIDGHRPRPAGRRCDPEVFGTAEAGSIVRIYADACLGTPLNTGTAAEFAAGITVTVPEDASTDLHAAATDRGRQRLRLLGGLRLRRGLDRSSGADDHRYRSRLTRPTIRTPSVIGMAEAGSIVTIYSDADCSDPARALGALRHSPLPGSR